MECIIAINGIGMNTHFNSQIAGWENGVKREIRNCIENGHIHNYIRDCNGKMVFHMHWVTSIVGEIAKNHRKWVEYTEEEKCLYNVTEDGRWVYDKAAIEEEKKVIVDRLVEEIFQKLCEVA